MMGVGFQQPWPQPQTMGGPSGFAQGPFYGTTQVRYILQTFQ